jgi:hypothetical protein
MMTQSFARVVTIVAKRKTKAKNIMGCAKDGERVIFVRNVCVMCRRKEMR